MEILAKMEVYVKMLKELHSVHVPKRTRARFVNVCITCKYFSIEYNVITFHMVSSGTTVLTPEQYGTKSRIFVRTDGAKFDIN